MKEKLGFYTKFRKLLMFSDFFCFLQKMRIKNLKMLFLILNNFSNIFIDNIFNKQ